MKKLAIFLFAFIFGLGLTQVSTAQKSNNKQSLLWKVSGNGLDKPSYLYGTIHLICPDDFAVQKEVKDAFGKTEITVLELDMDDPQMMQKMQKSSVNPGMKNLSTTLSEADQKVLNDFFTKNYNMNMTQLGIMKPFALTSMILTKLLPCQPESYEMTFVKMSTEAKKEVVGLETVSQQFGFFDQIPVATQYAWNVDMVKNMDKQSKEFQKLVDTYKTKNIDDLYALMAKSNEMKDNIDLLLNKRNANWIPQIEKIMKEQSAFIAVGAGHLGSEKGVIALLRAQGYKVKAVRY